MALSASIAVTPQATYNEIVFTNSTGADLPDSNELWRASVNETAGVFELIAQGIRANGRFEDHNVTTGEQYLYKGRAKQGVSVADSAVVSGTVNLDDTVIHGVTKVNSHSNAILGTEIILRVTPPHNHDMSRLTDRFNTIGEIKPVVDQSTIEEGTINLDTFTIFDPDTRAALEALYDSGVLICYRDPVNVKKFCAWRQFEQGFRDVQARMPLVLEEIYYPEEITV
jgi:hypothetical protein